MPNVDLNSAIRSLVAGEVEKILLPYKHLLERMAQFVGGKPAAKRGPGRPPKAVKAAVGGKRRQRRGKKARKGSKGDVSRFHDGQAVRYKQGRGEFAASVVSIDKDAGTLTLERTKDGKKVVRPAFKVY